METRQRILIQALQLFMRYGIRNVSMDDIAKELGISKKTIYQSFKDKAEIVMAVSNMQHDEEKRVMESFANQAVDALEETWLVMQYLNKTLKDVSPLLIYELQKYYPEAWHLHLNSSDSFHVEMIVKNLEKGIKEGIYRADIHTEIIARMRMAMVDSLFNSRWFPSHEFDLKEIHTQTFHFFLHGLLTEKGKERLMQLKNNERVKE